jgi:phage replication O-like protein O
MYTKVPNSFFDILPSLSGTEAMIMMVIYRNTYGWQRKSATLSLSTLAKLTGCSVRQCSTASGRLIAMGILSHVESQLGYVYTPIDNGIPDVVCDEISSSSGIAEIAIEEIAIAKIASPPMQKLHTYKERKESIATTSVDVAPKAKRDAKPKEDSPPDALSIFRSTHRLQVPIAIREQVVSAVTDLTKWEAICREWIARGYRKGNVSGCLEVYQKGWKGNAKSTQRGDTQRQHRESRMGSYLAEYADEIPIDGNGNNP